MSRGRPSYAGGKGRLPHRASLHFTHRRLYTPLIGAALTASLVTNSGHSTWFNGTLMLMVYLIFAMALDLLPPQAQ